MVRNFTVSELEPLINRKMLLHTWGIHGVRCSCGCDSGAEAERLLSDARVLLKEIGESGCYDGFGLLRIVHAHRDSDNLVVDGHVLPMLRQQKAGSGFRSLVDFVNPTGDYVGVFMAGAGSYVNALRLEFEKDGDSYKALLLQSLADRLAEASSELLHYLARTEFWGYACDEKFGVDRILRGEFQGIRPAMGYPMLPDQLLNKDVFEILEPESGKRARLTENGAIYPSATVSGLYIANPNSRYFMIGSIGEDQIEDYSRRRGLTKERILKILRQ